MKNQKGNNVRGIKIQTVSYLMILLACILYVLIIYATLRIRTRYDELVLSTDDYISSEENIALEREGSDYLTEQARLYAVTMDLMYAESYLEEVNVTKRREKALDEMKKYPFTENSRVHLETALENSNRLMEQELYSMKLISVAQDYDMERLPEEIREVQLTKEDEALSARDMVRKAQDMVFGEVYQAEKATIINDLDYFMEEILEQTRERQRESTDSLGGMLKEQRVFISILFVMNLFTFIMILILIVKPLQLYINSIKEGKLMQITGSYEFRYLALTYNDIYELNAANQELLRYKAEHDALTGIANRGAFDQLRQLLKAAGTPIALLLIDVDEFKQVNDGYGHEMGDRILKQVARLMKEAIRSKDYAARTGGDEFSIIMTDIGENQKKAIIDKIKYINSRLQNPEEDLPKVSLSVGAAFSAEGFTEDLYKRADEALYYVKEHGRNNYKFYEDL